jgi:WD40 repeat protein
MLSPAQRRALEIRLRILDTLESLVTQDPSRQSYQKQLSDFADNSTPEATRAAFAWLEGNEIADFIIPRDVTDTGFWESPVRIRKINHEKLQAALKSVRDELGSADPAASSNDTPGNSDGPDTSARSPIFTSMEGSAYLGMAGVIGLAVTLVGFVTALHALKTGLAQTLTVVGILVIVAAIARLYRSVKERRVSWQRSVTLLGFGLLCACATIVLASIIGLPGQVSSKLTGGSPVVSGGSSTANTPGTGAVNGVAFGPGEEFLADANRNGSAYIRRVSNLQSNSPIQLFDTPPTSLGVNSVAFSPNGELLAVGDDNDYIYLWRWTLAQKPHTTLLPNANCGGVYGVTFSHDGRLLAAACWNGLIYLWQVSNSSLSGPPLQANTAGINSVAFSPADNLLAAGGVNGNVYLWNVTSRKLIANLSTPPSSEEVSSGAVTSGGVYGVAFSHDGKLLAASSRDGTVYLWHVAGNHPEKLSPLNAPNSSYGLTSVAFSPVGNLLAAGDADGSIYVWNVTNRTMTTLVDSGGGEVNSVAFSGDGKLVGAGDAFGRLRVWSIGS